MKWSEVQTEQQKTLCYQLRSREYRRYYQNIPDESYQDEIDVACLPDGQSQSHTIMVMDDDAVVGTIRLAFAVDDRFPDIACEATQLMKLEGKLGDDLKKTIGTTDCLVIGELGKLAVSKDAGDKRGDVLRTVLYGSGCVAQALGVNILIGIVSPMVVKAINNVGGAFQPVENAHLNRQTYEHLTYLLKYHEYFLPGLAIHHPEVAQTDFVEGKTFAALAEMVSECNDGAHLYWNWTAAFLQSLQP